MKLFGGETKENVHDSDTAVKVLIESDKDNSQEALGEIPSNSNIDSRTYILEK